MAIPAEPPSLSWEIKPGFLGKVFESTFKYFLPDYVLLEDLV
jgi:hypothetical protein